MEKVIKDGKVAVLYSKGFGAGWSTWNYGLELEEELIFHPKLVEMVLNGRESEINKDWLVENLGEKYANVCCLGAGDLTIEWLPVGTRFIITEYDGAESIIVTDDLIFIA